MTRGLWLLSAAAAGEVTFGGPPAGAGVMWALCCRGAPCPSQGGEVRKVAASVAVHVPTREPPAANCTTNSHFRFRVCFPSDTDLVGRSPPKRQMEVRALPTCTHSPPPPAHPAEAHINLLLLRGAVLLGSRFALGCLEHEGFLFSEGPPAASRLMRGPSSGAVVVGLRPQD